MGLKSLDRQKQKILYFKIYYLFRKVEMEIFKKYLPVEVNTINIKPKRFHDYLKVKVKKGHSGIPGMPYPEYHNLFDHRQPETYFV